MIYQGSLTDTAHSTTHVGFRSNHPRAMYSTSIECMPVVRRLLCRVTKDVHFADQARHEGGYVSNDGSGDRSRTPRQVSFSFALRVANSTSIDNL